MINNWRLLSNLLIAGGFLAGCAQKPAANSEVYAGVVEYQERLMAFELGGRLVERPVERGDTVQAGQRLAMLDNTLEAAQSVIRQEQFEAASAQANLVKAGAKPEDLRALTERVSAARSTEQRLTTSLARERALLLRGVSPQAAVDDLERELDQAAAQRAALEADLASLKKGARGEEIASVRAQAAAARSEVDLGEELIARYELKAPIAGEVLDVHVEPGETVAAGAPVVTLADVRHPIVEVFVPQQRAAGLKPGVVARVRIDGLSADSFSAKVEYVARKLEFTPRFLFSDQERPRLVLRVRVRVDDPGQKLVAGVPAFVSFQ